MKLSTQTHMVCERLGDEKGVELLCKTGYDALDMSCFDMFDDNSPKMGSGSSALARRLLTIANDHGVYFNQAHAPFPCAKADAAYNTHAFDCIVRSMEFSASLGVRNIVVHPIHYLFPYPVFEEQTFRDNMNFYERLLPYCEEFNIHIAVENMWHRLKDGTIIASACATPADFKRYMDALSSPWFVACLDFGHVHLIGEHIPTMIRTLGQRLDALHAHDVGYGVDLHTLPYLGTIKDWDASLAALNEVGYTGELTFEADNFFHNMPDDYLPTALKYMHDTGRGLIARAEAMK